MALGGTSTPWLQLNSGTVVVLAEDVPSQPAQAGPRVRVVGFFSLPPLAATSRRILQVKWTEQAQGKKKEGRHQSHLVTRTPCLEDARSLWRRRREASVGPRCTNEQETALQGHFVLQHDIMQRNPGNTSNFAISCFVTPMCMNPS